MSTRRNIPMRRQPSKIQTTGNDEIVNLVDVKDKAQNFYSKYQNLILYGSIGLALLVSIYLAYKFLYIGPREKEAVIAMYQAESQFARDSFAAALTNPGGGAEGFESIIESYSWTKAGNTAKLYAGICNLRLGKYQEAIDYLESYSPKDDITPSVKFSAMADAASELGDMDKAYGYYEQAAKVAGDEFSAPYHLNRFGLLQYHLKKYDEAFTTFKKIVDEYPNSQEAREAEKFVTRLEK